MELYRVEKGTEIRSDPLPTSTAGRGVGGLTRSPARPGSEAQGVRVSRSRSEGHDHSGRWEVTGDKGDGLIIE